MEPLDDGEYDVFVVDAVRVDESMTRVDLAITAGARKGDVVSLHARVEGDAIALLGLPATLTVERGEPRVAFERA